MLKFDEINKLTELKLEEVAGREDRNEELTDFILYLLIEAIKDAVEDTEDMLEYILASNLSLETMDSIIYEPIDGKTFEERVGGSDKELKRLIETESHRVYTSAQMETARQIQKESGMNINKTWVTMKDNRVRETHEPLEGITIPLEDKFVSYDGDEAYQPGGFSRPDNNINCRCYLQFEENR